MRLGDIFRVSLDFDQLLVARERVSIARLVNSYSEIERQMSAEIDRLVRSIEDAKARGEDVASKRWQVSRLETLKASIPTILAPYLATVNHETEGLQREFSDLGEESAKALVNVQLPQGVSVGTSFATLPEPAVRKIVGVLGDGSPLVSVIERIGGDVAGKVSDTLVSAIALGWNPRRTAREMKREFGVSKSSSLNMIRTESLRAFREGNRETFAQNSDVVKGWIWNAHLGSVRTCAACIALHGSRWDTSEPMGTHPSCRCAMIPIVEWEGQEISPEVPKGSDWFADQTRSFQREVLGDAKYEAYRTGQIGLENLVGVTYSQQWGYTRYERSLRSALGGVNQHAFAGG